MTRNNAVLFLIICLAVLPGGWACAPGDETPRKNLIIIVSDTLRADYLGCYGFPLDISPNIDDLAARGTLFEITMSCSPHTAGSHASLLTGTYPTRHRVISNYGLIPRRLKTLADVLRAEGYETGAVVSSPVLTPKLLSGIERGFNSFYAKFSTMERNRKLPYRDARSAAEAALFWLNKNSGTPFFFFLHFMEPHGPYEVPDPSLLRLVKDLPRNAEEPETLTVLSEESGRGGIPSYQILGEENDPRVYRERYAARIAYMDRQLGRVLSEIDKLGIDENTLVLFVSDHGELLGEYDYYFQHGFTVLNPVLHVPLLLAGPGVPRGRRVASLVGNTDIMPTVLELLEIRPEARPSQMEGTSLVPLMEGAGEEERIPRYALCAMMEEWCVMFGRHKYAFTDKGEEEEHRLVDLREGDGEPRDISADNPEITEKLRECLRAFKDKHPDIFSIDSLAPSNLSEEDRQRLRALGYLK